MNLKELKQDFKDVKSPKDSNDLPILSWDKYVEEANREGGQKLIFVGGFIHDVTKFINEHPAPQKKNFLQMTSDIM
jgi:stearoyl-CoA desaturase (delta-9 desaturase)